jgi:hypothetical protein
VGVFNKMRENKSSISILSEKETKYKKKAEEKKKNLLLSFCKKKNMYSLLGW